LFTGTAVAMDIYEISGTYVGNEGNQSAWSLVASGNSTSAGGNNATVIDFADFPLSAGAHGLSLVWTTNAVHSYTTGNGSNQNYSKRRPRDHDRRGAERALERHADHAARVERSHPLLPRRWRRQSDALLHRGHERQRLQRLDLCTGNPNVAHTAPCVISISNLDGQRAGIIFYSLASLPQPWCRPAEARASCASRLRPCARRCRTAAARRERATARWRWIGNAFQLATRARSANLGGGQQRLRAGLVPRPAELQDHLPLERDQADLLARDSARRRRSCRRTCE
jgi:hypothetical protein